MLRNEVAVLLLGFSWLASMYASVVTIVPPGRSQLFLVAIGTAALGTLLAGYKSLRWTGALVLLQVLALRLVVSAP